MKRVDVSYVLLFDEVNEKILMVKNTGPIGSYYTLPGGAVEPGETLQQAAVREVKEETGLDVEVNGIQSVMEAFFEVKGHHAIFFVFKGEVIGGEIEITLPEEIEEVVWMDVQEAEKYLNLPEGVKGFPIMTAPYSYHGRVKHTLSQRSNGK
ncbi:NUDIX hydrolase [Sutcliffiella horikoshii]|uniref:NUDIX hydrolase n=1 Tax=Sutcliffiella horikoshii TaxID=79883 RepID=UPI001F38FB4C|nr:NUDIX hydrolase [Sutcliffiella horikoshii]MCG1023293.1 NUDIX hydrolase [Sutcliffiella horikoshii]